MKPPLSYVPLLPLTLAVTAVILLLQLFQQEKDEPDGSRRYCALVTANRINDTGQHITAEITMPDGSKALSLLTIPSLRHHIEPGDSVNFNVRLKKPVARDNRENDYSSYLQSRGIEFIGFVAPDSINVTGSAQSIYWRIKRLRPLIGDMLKRSRLDDRTCGFLIATLTGDSDILDTDTRRLYSSAGTAHILALSGLHVGIIIIAIYIVLFPLYLLRLRGTLYIISILILWGYAIITGLSASVTRAVIMATVVTGGILLQRRYSSFNALLLAAIIIMSFDRRALFQPGFQLSFCAVAVIILLTPLLLTRKRRGNRIMYYLLAMLTTTLTATAGTAIISAFHFHSLPVYFILANIPSLLVLPVILSGGLLIVAAEATGIDSFILCHITDHAYLILHRFTEFVAEMPGAVMENLYFSGWAAIPYFLTIGVIALWLWKRHRVWFTASLAMVCVTAATIFFSSPTKVPEECFFVKSTYETSILFRHGDKASFITTAPRQKAGGVVAACERRYSDYLGRNKVKSLDIALDSIAVGSLRRSGNYISFGDRSYLLVMSPDDTIAGKRPANMVVCRGFRENIMDLVTSVRPDTVILGADLHPRRHDRYADSLTRHDIPWRSLKTAAVTALDL